MHGEDKVITAGFSPIAHQLIDPTVLYAALENGLGVLGASTPIRTHFDHSWDNQSSKSH